MNAVFADTFFWIALTNVQDQAHERAKSFARSATPSTIFTTEEVLTEYLNYFASCGKNTTAAHRRRTAKTKQPPPTHFNQRGHPALSLRGRTSEHTGKTAPSASADTP